MKVAAFILTTVLSVVLLMGGALLLVFTQEEPSGLALVVLILGPMAFVLAGLFAGSFLLTSGHDPATPDGRRFFTRVGIVLGVVALVGVGALVTIAALGEVSVVFALGWIVAGLAYVAANVVGAEYLRRRDIRLRPTQPPAPPVDADFRRRRVRALVWWFVGVLVVGLAAAVVVAAATRDLESLPVLTGLALSFAALAAMMVSLTAIFRVNRHVRDLLGTDTARNKRIGRVVIRGKADALSTEESDLARRYAPLASLSLFWSAAQFSFLYVALLAQNVPQIWLGGDFQPLRVILSVFFIVSAAVFIPLMLNQRRQVERYRAAHPLLTDGVPDTVGRDGRG